MTQEEKQLLLVDLCARLPYGTMCNVVSLDNPWIGDCVLRSYWLDKVTDVWFEIKPYLRPMSSMTEDEKMEYENARLDWYDDLITYDWLNAHHFDYRGLIPMGLALEAPEGMYKN